MRKPVIGLIPLVDEGRQSYWMLPGYMQGIARTGGIGVMLSLTDEDDDIRELVSRFDGFVFTGGHDVSPVLYGQEKLPVCGDLCPQRDSMEAKLLAAALRVDKPVLGICRGLQLMNVVLGGTLWQGGTFGHLPGCLCRLSGNRRGQQLPPSGIPGSGSGAEGLGNRTGRTG